MRMVRVGTILLFLFTLAAGVSPGPVKLAFFNIQSGKGEVGLPDRPVLFTDTQNCADRTQPINAWGVGFVQRELVKAVKDDPAVVALGLAEAWLCGSPENVRQLLGWAAKSSSRNGLAVVARYGFAGPETWQQLDTSRNPNPKDTMWVVRVPVCLDASCLSSILMYSAHWFGTGPEKLATYDRQAQQTLEFMTQTAAGEPHVLIGDLNVWEGSAQCGQQPNTTGIPRLRDAGYIDAWPRIHGGAEGFTGMTNRKGCGSPAGYAWKRIDYAWSSPRFVPSGITRFAVPETPGSAAASDHYGIIATYPMPTLPHTKPQSGEKLLPQDL
jgi:exonuclease III